MERLKSTHEKLAEVSSATEMAATGMLDGLDRALGLVDEMDDADGSGGTAERHGALRDSLREELHTLISLLQFQDITSQQLGYANAVLLDIEGRMVELAGVFDLGWLGLDGEGDGAVETPARDLDGASVTCDPGASHFGAQSRQALADEIFR